jgi:hypothetical protein
MGDKEDDEQGQELRKPQMTTEGARQQGQWDDEGTRHPPPLLQATARRVDSRCFDNQRTPQCQRWMMGGTITQDNDDTHSTRRMGWGEKRAQMTMELFAPQVIFCMFVYLFFCWDWLMFSSFIGLVMLERQATPKTMRPATTTPAPQLPRPSAHPRLQATARRVDHGCYHPMTTETSRWTPECHDAE